LVNAVDNGENVGKLIAFPGGGIYFWWQAGWITCANISSDAHLIGASAGSLTAVLSKCGVNMEDAYSCAIRLCEEYGVFSEPQGLLGKWGFIVRDWLDALLPIDAHDRCRGQVHILVTQVALLKWPPLKRIRVSDFTDRADLIEACMASVHGESLLINSLRMIVRSI